jgi:hypothetical protein
VVESARPVSVSLTCAPPVSVGDALGNAAAVHGGLVVATGRGVVQVVSGGTATPLDLDAKELGGVYHLGDGKVMVLEFGGSRVFELLWKEGSLTRLRTFEVGPGPRLLRLGDGVVRVVSRDPDRPLSDIDLSSGAVTPVRGEGRLAADVEWHAGTFHGAWIHEAKVGEVSVQAEPYRLHAAASGLYALHAGMPLLTRVSDGKTLTLTGPATRIDGDLAVLLSGGGSLQVVRDMQVAATHAVPVGASDLAVQGGIAVVAAGSTGTLTLVNVGDARPVATPTVTVPFAAGRLHVGPELLWVTGPQSGQIAACTWSR